MGDKNFIAGIGCTNVDILYSGIDRLPNEGEEIYAKHFSLQLGGGVPATLINLGSLELKLKLRQSLEMIFFQTMQGRNLKNAAYPLLIFIKAMTIFRLMLQAL